MNDRSNVYRSEYPKQILSNIKHTKKGISTFAIETLFGYQDPLPDNPLSLMNGYSVYSLALIQNNVAVTANLRPTDLAALTRKSELVFDMAFRHRYFQHFRAFHAMYQVILRIRDKISATVPKQTDSPDLKAAFSCTFSWGKYKGKTPGDALLEYEDSLSELIRTKTLLEKNADRYPNNRKLIAAIDTAVTSFNQGTLKKEENTADTPDEANRDIFLYEGVWKNKTGKNDKKVMDNLEVYRCYKLTIKYQPFMNTYPITVIIENCFIPVKKQADGRQNILTSQAVQKTYTAMKHSFTFEEWLDIIDTMQQARQLFCNMTYPSMYKLAQQCDMDNRSKAK